MASISLLPGAMSSGEFQVHVPERVEAIEHRHRRIVDFLKEQALDAALLTRPSSFAWLTGGGNNTRGDSSDVVAALFITADARVVLTRNADSGRLFDREVGGLGFQLKERTWQEDRSVLMSDVVRGRGVASDAPFDNCADYSLRFSGMRLPLETFEIRRLRTLGLELAHCVEATARSFNCGETEADIAGQTAHRMLRRRIHPERIQVWGDGRGERYRHWGFDDDPVEQFCTITAVGRREGLHLAVSRTMAFAGHEQRIRPAHLDTLLVQVTGMCFSRHDWEIYETWNRVERIYEKFGHTEEWHFADQGCVTGYELCEVPIVPKSEFRLQPGMPMIWQSSIGPAQCVDTIAVAKSGFELLTPTESWPKVNVNVKRLPVSRPDVLVRPASTPS